MRISPPPVDVGAERSLLYKAAEDTWWLCYPCAACGGTELPLSARPRVSDIAQGACHFHPALDVHRCPACDTRRNRSGDASRRPNVWYDTVLQDWVVQVPWIGPGEGAILPLEIRWFDAPQATVYRAAGDVIFSGDEFEQASGD
jgi:hypothetical protein